jgi:hypothetical protein
MVYSTPGSFNFSVYVNQDFLVVLGQLYHNFLVVLSQLYHTFLRATRNIYWDSHSQNGRWVTWYCSNQRTCDSCLNTFPNPMGTNRRSGGEYSTL